MKKKIISALIALSLILSAFVFPVSAAEAEYESTEFSAQGFDSNKYMTDRSHNSYSKGQSDCTVTLENAAGIAHLYIIFDKIPGQWTLCDNGTKKEVTLGKDSFLHEYANIVSLFGKPSESLTLSFENAVGVSEVYGFSAGELPDWVQVWEKPLEKADILLLSSHSDDEQLFFAGILPYYAGEVGAAVQVVYLISHFDTHNRPHEQLDGLWTVGVRNYPIISDFPDLYSESLEGAKSIFANAGHTYEDFEKYITENIRRFKPQVLITHDIEGEYSHGTHILCTDVVMNVLDKTADADFLPESAEQYGVWDVPKTYLHLYEENPIVMNWDIPLKAFDGKTAFEMTLEGFACHKSQHWTWFNDWIHGTAASPVTKAADIRYYSPCKYGLYRTTVGYDVLGGDFLENITLYKDMEVPEPEAEPEVTEKPPAETEPSTETEKPEEEKVDEGAKKQSPMTLIIIILGISATVIVIYLLFFAGSNKKKKKRRF